jgi:hypothetical protein
MATTSGNGGEPIEMTGGPAELSDRERNLLWKLEGLISDAEAKMYWTCGKALRPIRDRRLYRHEGTFEDYCQKRWGWPRQTGNRYIKAVEVAEDLAAGGFERPMTEKQCRPLGRLDSANRREVAQRVAHEGGWRALTAARVAEIADEVSPRPGHSQEVIPGYEGMALVYTGRGPALRTARRTGIREAIEQMRSAANRISSQGPHAASDVVAIMSADEADDLRFAIADVSVALSLLAHALVEHHGPTASGQQIIPEVVALEPRGSND